VSLEENDFPESLIRFLENKKFRIDKRGSRAFYLGCIQAVIQKTDGQGFQGAADIRRDGTAVGVDK
jgi:gamma-glutamyltranspeptidase/glutathione hydrolase